jgi:uncharacterized membrane protein
MWMAVRAFIAPYMRQMLIGGAVFAAITAFWAFTYHAGERAEKVDTLVKQTKTVRKVHAIEDKNRRVLHDGDAVRKLHESWSRD